MKSYLKINVPKNGGGRTSITFTQTEYEIICALFGKNPKQDKDFIVHTIKKACENNTPAEFKEKISKSVLESLTDPFVDPEPIKVIRGNLNASDRLEQREP